MIEIYFDGCCEQNGTPHARAAWGWVAKDAGARIAEDAGRVPEGQLQTNNTGEYTALLEGLRWLTAQAQAGRDLGAVRIFGDSQLVVNQVSGYWQVGSPHLAPLCAEARALAAPLGARLQWVKRERNGEADTLAQSGLLRA